MADEYVCDGVALLVVEAVLVLLHVEADAAEVGGGRGALGAAAAHVVRSDLVAAAAAAPVPNAHADAALTVVGS